VADRLLGAGDAGRSLELAPGDRLVVALPETPGSGYVWEVEELPAGGTVVEDRRDAPERSGIGGATTRVFVLDAPGPGRVALRRVRPWLGEDGVSERFEVDVRVGGAG
jgi:inhibitor of cysteine peptidase